MPPVSVVELTTGDFGRWVQRARLVLPVPLNAGHAARIDLDLDELLAVSEERLEVDNAIGGVPPAQRHLPDSARDLVGYAEGILRDPTACVWAGRGVVGGEDSLVVGFAAGDDGLVVVDTADRITLRRTTAAHLAATVVSMLPAVRPVRLEPVTVPRQALAALRAGSSERGLDRVSRNLAAAAGIPEEALLTLAKLQASLTAQGMIGAVRYDGGDVAPGAVGADWFESTGGAVLKREGAAGEMCFEPATAATLTSAAIAALAGAR